jgi:hypothetical protein
MKSYDFVDDFQNDFARVRKDDKYGYINKQGKEVIPLIYDEVYNFQNDFAIVRNNNKFGFINREGIEVIPLIYDNASQADKELKKYIKKSFMESL